MKHKAIVTVVYNITASNVEFNEFVLYRAKHFANEEHYVVSYCTVDSDFLQQSGAGELKNVTIFDCHNSYFKLRNNLQDILKTLSDRAVPVFIYFGQPRESVVVHLLNLLFLRNVPTLYGVHSTFNLYPIRTKISTLANFPLVDYIYFVSHAAYRGFPQVLRRIKKNKIHIIPNGVDLDRVDRLISSYKSTEESAEPSRNRVFKLINIGRLVKAKNQGWLVKLLTKLPEQVTLTIVGEGKLRKELEDLAQKIKVSHRVRITGRILREQVYKELLNADLFVSSSIREGMPMGVLEAMALRLPTLLSEIEPHKEIGQYGSSVGVIPLDVTVWIKRIKQFISTPKDERGRIGQNNRQIVESHFSLRQMHEQYTALYEQLWRRVQR